MGLVVQESVRAPEKPEKKVTIGLLDDSALDLAWVRRLLSRLPGWEFEILEFVDPEQAIETLTKQTVDLILTDYHMGQWNGFDVLERLRGEGQDAPAVLLTGADLDTLPPPSLAANVSHFLAKDGLSAAQLTTCFESLLGPDGPLV